ncbi:MAG: hypothetical protein H0X36_11755 [Sphingomonadaceae bacterium]|nr:hypothetical protein [Sphingomonadaceae bacterium]
MVSMNAVWDESAAFMRREAHLLVPLALATLLLGNTVGTLAQLAAPRGDIVASLVMIAGALWSIIGQLAIAALALRPGSSVGEALKLGASRLGKLLVVALLLGAVIFVACLPLVFGLAKSGYNPADPQIAAHLPAWAVFYTLLVIVILFWVSVRLSVLNALIVDRNPSPLAALREAFALTRGVAARLTLALILYAIVAFVVSLAVRFVLGSLFLVIARGLNSPFAGAVLDALASGLVATGFVLVATVFLAFLYRRLSNGI